MIHLEELREKSFIHSFLCSDHDSFLTLKATLTYEKNKKKPGSKYKLEKSEEKSHHCY